MGSNSNGRAEGEFADAQRDSSRLDLAEQVSKDRVDLRKVPQVRQEHLDMNDCITTNELMSHKALSLTPEGTAGKFIADDDNTFDRRVVTNHSLDCCPKAIR